MISPMPLYNQNYFNQNIECKYRDYWESHKCVHTKIRPPSLNSFVTRKQENFNFNLFENALILYYMISHCLKPVLYLDKTRLSDLPALLGDEEGGGNDHLTAS